MRMISLLGQAGDLLPQVERLIVLGEHRDGQPLRRQAEFLGDQVPGELDGVVLEIIAEREVAEHLEEGVVARGVADIVEVVVLAAGAHAFLRRHRPQIGPLLQAGEDVLELHHAGIGEHQGRVVARHERRRRHHGVTVAGEIIEEARPDLVDATHRSENSSTEHAAPRSRICASCRGERKLRRHGAWQSGVLALRRFAVSPRP